VAGAGEELFNVSSFSFQFKSHKRHDGVLHIYVCVYGYG
jgi:hypothetical protein